MLLYHFRWDGSHVKDSFPCLIPVVDGTVLYNACTKYFEEKNIPYKKNMVVFAAEGTNYTPPLACLHQVCPCYKLYEDF